MSAPTILPFEHGLSWVQDELMQRASHALAVDGQVWLIDPVDDEEAIWQAQTLGEIAGVIQLLDRHPRDCKALAERFGVPHLLLPDDLPVPQLQVQPVVNSRFWMERAIWWPDTGTLVVAELVGTNAYYALGDGPVGVHPFMRALTGKTVGTALPVQHLLTGHGLPVHEHAAEALRRAYARRLRDLPLVPLGAARAALGKR